MKSLGFTGSKVKASLSTDQNFAQIKIAFNVLGLNLYTFASTYKLYNAPICSKQDRRINSKQTESIKGIT